MRYFIAIAVALVIFVQASSVANISKAPVVIPDTQQDANNHQTTDSSFTRIDPEKETLLQLLEAAIDHQHDLSMGAQIIDEQRQRGQNQGVLDEYEAKIISRSLQFEEAKQLLNQLDRHQLSLLRAAVYIALDERDQASDYLHQLIAEHPNPEIKTTAMALLNIYNRYDKHRDTERSYLWTLFAQKLSELGEPEISLYLANKAIHQNPSYRDALIIKGYNEIVLRSFEQAEASLLKAYQQDPGNSHIQYLLGICYFHMDKADLSSEYLLYAQQNDSPYQLDILSKLGENAIKTEQYELASHYFEEALKKSPVNKQALSRLIWINTKHFQDYETALKYARTLTKEHDEDPDSFHLLSWVQTQRGEIAAAEAALNTANSLSSP